MREMTRMRDQEENSPRPEKSPHRGEVGLVASTNCHEEKCGGGAPHNPPRHRVSSARAQRSIIRSRDAYLVWVMVVVVVRLGISGIRYKYFLRKYVVFGFRTQRAPEAVSYVS